MKRIYLLIALFFIGLGLQAQSLDELKAMKAEKEKIAGAKQAEADAV
ncbi:MAG: hypothetical protein RLZZ546_3338, partial [Bacteroidota bacterium]